MSLFLRGICKGTRNDQRTNKKTGEVYNDVFVGFSVQVQGDYGTTTELVEVKLSRAQITANLQAVYNAAKDKELIAPVWVRVWQSADKSKVGHELWLSGDGKPSAVPAPKAAG